MEVLKNNILVIQTAFLGDCLLTVPFLFRLHRLNPDCKIDVVTTPAARQVFSSLGFVDTVYTLDKRGKHKRISAVIGFAKNEIGKHYSLLYSLHRSFRSTLLAMFISAETRLTYDKTSLSLLFDKTFPYRPDLHEIERHLVLLNEKKFDQQTDLFSTFNFTETANLRIKEILSGSDNTGMGFIAIAPGSVWETKKYPAMYFAEICRFYAEKGVQVLILGSEAEKDTGELIRRESGSENILNLCGRLEILETILILKQVKLLISNDSAPAHMAYLAGTPVLMLYCSTVPEFGFYPYGSNSGYVSLQKVCKPCGIHGLRECPLGTFVCANDMKPSIVLEKAKTLHDFNF